MTRFNASLAVSTLMVFFTFGASVRDALGVDWIAETAPYNVDSNWSSSFVPDQEVAAITNGGTAIIDDTPPDISRLRLGNTDFGGRGTLEILSGGELFATEVEVGGSDFNTENGVGRLRIHRGAELIALTLTSEGDSSSSIVLGDVDGSGTACNMILSRSPLWNAPPVRPPAMSRNSGKLFKSRPETSTRASLSMSAA